MKEARQRKQDGHGDHGHDKHSPVTKHDLEAATKKILMKVSELNAKLTAWAASVEALTTEVNKVIVEIKALIGASANTDLPPEVQASIDRLESSLAGLGLSVKTADELNVDPVTTPVTPG